MAVTQPTLTQRILRQWESPPTWLLLFALIAWLQSVLVPIWDAGGLADWLGSAFIFAGILLMAAAFVQFKRARTSVLPREMPRVLIADGVYQLSRNPIYVADALMLTGLGFRLDLATLVWVVVFVVVIDRRFIDAEEAVLRAKFGSQFDNWAEKVRRWL